jgi:hypothetical protein
MAAPTSAGERMRPYCHCAGFDKECIASFAGFAAQKPFHEDVALLARVLSLRNITQNLKRGRWQFW